MTKIAVLGAGAAGTSIINSLKKTDNEIIVGIRDQSKFEGAVPIDEAIKNGQIVVFALPYQVGYQIAEKYKAELAGKIVVDMMNPFKSDLSGYNTFAGKSGAEHLQDTLPDAQVVETFNHVDGPVLADPQGALQFVIGDDETATDQVTNLANKAGFDAQTVLDLTKAREAEAFAFLWVYFSAVIKKNPNLKLKLE